MQLLAEKVLEVELFPQRVHVGKVTPEFHTDFLSGVKCERSVDDDVSRSVDATPQKMTPA